MVDFDNVVRRFVHIHIIFTRVQRQNSYDAAKKYEGKNLHVVEIPFKMSWMQSVGEIMTNNEATHTYTNAHKNTQTQ